MHCSRMKHAYVFFHNKSNKYKSNLLYPVSQFFITYWMLWCQGRAISHFRCLKSHSFAWSFRFFASPFRCFVVSDFRPLVCFASPFRSFVSPFHSLAWPFRSFAVSLFRNLALSVFRSFVGSPIRCFAISLFRCFEISLFRTLVASTSIISYLFCFEISLFRTFVVSNSDVMVNTTVCRAGIDFSADTLMWCHNVGTLVKRLALPYITTEHWWKC